MATPHRVLILGGGFGGLTVATDLAARRVPGLQVTLVDQRPNYVMGLAKLWALDGRRPLEAARQEYRRLQGRGIEFVRGVVRAIDVANRKVDVDGRALGYDSLVVALGAEYAPERLPGFAPNMDLYAEAGVEHLRRQLEALRSGQVLVLVSSLPFKCPPAPYEAALLVDAMLRRRGVRSQVRIGLATPESHPLPVAPPEYGSQLARLLEQKGIQYHPNHVPLSIEEKGRIVHFNNGATLPFDVLLGVPPHRAPAIVRQAGLADDTGWIPAEPKTLKTRFPSVWAIGDVAAVKLPNGKLLPKAGTLAAGEGRVVASQIAAEAGGGAEVRPFDGRGVCFIETGDGGAIPAQGHFFEEPPRFDLQPPSLQGLREKEGFERNHLKAWFG